MKPQPVALINGADVDGRDPENIDEVRYYRANYEVDNLMPERDRASP